MTTVRHKICPVCRRICASTDAACVKCRTPLGHAKEIDVPAQTIQRHTALHGEPLVMIPPTTARVDDDYLNLFRRPTLYRRADAYAPTLTVQTDTQYIRTLLKRARSYQLFGLVGFVSAIVFFGMAFGMTLGRWFAWQVAWWPPTPLWPILVPLGYLVTVLQLFATYTALRARDHALFLVEYMHRNQ